MSVIEMAVVPEKEYKVVSDASIARRLLKDGYRIVDIKPKVGTPKASVFVFAIEGDFMDVMGHYIQERKEKFDKKEEK